MDERSLPVDGALVVVRPFGRHKTGDLIGGSVAIRDTMTGEHAGHVVVTQISAASVPKAQES